MCGICGYSGIEDDSAIGRMMSALIHRGPDEAGTYKDADVVLGHRRLSIIDLDTGRQPIFNEDKSLVVIFNGEIYNYIELREALKKKGHQFYTESDTEVIVHLYEEYGQECVGHMDGMFAFALWDKKRKSLIIARDRLGIKPLYYYHKGSCFAFSSEMRALRELGAIESKIDMRVLSFTFAFRYSPFVEDTIFKEIKRLPPGTVVVYRQGELKSKQYWDIPVHNIQDTMGIKQAEEKLAQLLEDAVKKRLRSDVPIGIHLSGGLDSFSLVWLMTKYRKDVPTFTLEIRRKNDEVHKAQRVSEYFGLKNYSLRVNWNNFLDDLKCAVRFIDEPILCSNILLGFYVAKFNKDFVKVVLCGDGADELFAGYVHHPALYYSSKYKGLSSILKATPAYMLDALFSYPASLGGSGVERFRDFLSTGNPWRRYVLCASIFTPEEVKALFNKDVGGHIDAEPPLWLQYYKNGSLRGIIDYELKSWLPNYMLLKLDRMSMASSVEARVPFLDYRIAEFAVGLPDVYKIRFFKEKYLLRSFLKRHQKQWVHRQKKCPFVVPAKEPLTKHNLQRIKEILYSKELENQQLFDTSYIESLVRQYEKAPYGILLNKKIMALVIWELWRDSNNLT